MGHESRCPACGKRAYIPEWVLAVVLVLIAGLVGGGILAAGRMWNGTERGAAGPQDAYAAAREFVLKQPGLKGPAVFAPLDETVIDRWGPSRYRVSGRAQAREGAGKAVNLMYSCVVERDGHVWSLDDMAVQLLK